MYRTDLAVESLSGQPTGCVVNEFASDGVKRTDVEIKTEDAAKRLGKPKGFYSTIESKGLFRQNNKAQKTAADAISKVLSQVLKDHIRKKKYTVLIAGLGNSSMTADALGPRVCRRLIVTRQFENSFPESGGGVQSLCAISPGVLGVTGIETYDVIAGLVKRIKPDAVITVDSLASRTVSRLASAFQVTDSGISPGSGVNNHRFRLDKKTLGVPVIAVGVPLVVYASTIASEAMDEFFKREQELLVKKDKAGKNGGASGADANLKQAVVNSVIGDVLGDMVVTPKDIDLICDDCAYIIALAINAAAHGMTVDAAAKLMV